MGLLDSIVKNAQKAVNEKVDSFNKKVIDFQEKITNATLDTIIKESAVKTKKPNRSIESISEQVITLRNSIIKNGFKEYEFIANSNCCEICAKLNGKHFPISQFKIGVNAPPMHEGCRCSIAAYEDSTEYEEWLNRF